MIAVFQRVSSARVVVEGQVVGQIGKGLCILCAVQKDDTDKDLTWMAERVANLRVMPEGDKEFHLDVKQAGAEVLLVSNFTVAAITNLSRRPTLNGAADPETARGMFEQLLAKVRELGVSVQTGRFREHMDVTIENDGPITFIVDSRA
jgi:D-tyrosyl-tRNA(Tyr) deacylase